MNLREVQHTRTPSEQVATLDAVSRQAYEQGRADGIALFRSRLGKAGARRAAAEIANDAMREAIESAIEHIAGYVDVKDSEHGPVPNGAMAATMELERALGRRP